MWTDELKKGDRVAVVGRRVVGWSKVKDVLAVDVVERTTPTRVVLVKNGAYNKTTTRECGKGKLRKILPAGSQEVAEIRRRAAADRRQYMVEVLGRALSTIGWKLADGKVEKVLDFLLELVAEETSTGSAESS